MAVFTPDLGKERSIVHNDSFKFEKVKRSIFTDWMRSIAIYLVVCAHILVTISWTVDMSRHNVPIDYKGLRADTYIWAANCKPGHWNQCILNLREGVYIFNPLKAKIFSIFRAFVQFGMPAFMYFSGRSLAFNKDRFCIFLYKKFSRLFVPLLVGYFAFVVPTSYISCEWRPGMDEPETSRCHKGFFEFYGWMVSNFKDGFSWLWFLPALLILSLANYPFATWYQHRYWENLRGFDFKHDMTYLPMILGLVVGLIIALVLALGTSVWYGLLVSLPYALNIGCLYGVHFIRRVGRVELLLGVSQMVPSLVLTIIHNDELGDSSTKRMVAAICFYNFFYMQGFTDQVLDAEYLQFKQTRGHKKWRPIGLLLLMLIVAITSPGTEFNVGYLWTYPIYRTWPETMAYVGGSWIWMVIFVRWGQTFFEDYFQENKFFYSHLTATSIVVYMVHWLLIDALVALITRPAKLNFIEAICVLFPGTILLSWLVYLLVRYVPFVGLLFGYVQPGRSKKDDDKQGKKAKAETDAVSDEVKDPEAIGTETL